MTKSKKAKEEELEQYYTSPHEDIAAAYNALYAISDIDTKLSGRDMEDKILEIKEMSINIIHAQLKWINDCIFGDIENQ